MTQIPSIKQIFTETIPGIKEPIPIQFYIPEEFDDKESLVSEIEKRGGVIVFKPTVLSFQITELKAESKDKSSIKENFYDGLVYNADLIKDSIKDNKFTRNTWVKFSNNWATKT